MWIYSPADIETRLGCDTVAGFLLDYWLLLHSDQSAPIVGARPIGISTLADAVITMQDDRDRALLLAIGQETESVQQLASYLPLSCPMAPAVHGRPPVLSNAWRRWLLSMADSGYLATLRYNLCSAIHTAVKEQDVFALSFVLRRFAAELASLNRPSSELFSLARSLLQVPHEADTFAERFISLFVDDSSAEYSVRFAVVPVYVIRSGDIRAMSKKLSRSPYEFEKDSAGRNRLVALAYTVTARTPHDALARSLPLLRASLEYLRLRYYASTAVFGDVIVTRTNAADVVNIDLPQPFWPQERGGRTVPRMPSRFLWNLSKVAPDDATRWKAAVRHLSNAIDVWAEDVHSAASAVWQALEAAGGSRQAVKHMLAVAYINQLGDALAESVSRSVSVTARMLAKTFPGTDWYYRDPSRVSAREWLDCVQHPASTRHARIWRHPRAWEIVAHKRVGLLGLVRRLYYKPASERWVWKRVEGDLDLLYALRNAFVHRGVRLGNDRLAGYLARLGVEILFARMKEIALAGLKPKQAGTALDEVNSIIDE